MPKVKNIDSLQYFLNRFGSIDAGYNYCVNYHKDVESNFSSLPTFVAEFFDCKTHSCPLLLTNENHLITNHVWNLTYSRKHKPGKTHGLWTSWGESIDISLPKVTRKFNETYTYVWLPIDEESANNPWHVLIDMISKFRLIEKRWSTPFSNYIFVLSTQSDYFVKLTKELFNNLNYMIMPKDETWEFKHLIVPSLSNNNDGVITPQLAPWIRILKKHIPYSKKEKKNKIFVTREDAKTRKLLDSEKLVMALKGWKTVTLEKLSIREQIECFSNASNIVSTHGAGLTNLVWSDPGTRIIEIQDKKMIHKKVYPVLSHHLGLVHELYLAQAVPIPYNGKKPKGVKRLNDLIDLQVELPDLIRHLD